MLTDTKIKNLKPRSSEYKTADGYGLTIITTPKGVKKWRFRYRFNHKPSMISLGIWPAVSLADARALRLDYQAVLDRGVNPSTYKKQKTIELRSDSTFRSMFDRWYARHMGEWTERTAKKMLAAFEKHIFPYIGDRQVSSITPLDMLEVFRAMDDKGIHEVLKKTKGWASRVFCDCVVSGLIDFDPTRDLPSDAFKRHKTRHYSTVTSPEDIGELLSTLSSYKEKGTIQVAEALSLAPYLLLRPGELCKTEWTEVDFSNRVIRIEGGRMKITKSHLVPMSESVLLRFQEIRELNLSSKYVFPSPSKSNSPINTETLRAAIRRLGISKEQFTTHGFRGMASTRLHELGFRTDLIEIQLSHTDRNQVRRAYNHAEYLEERKEMMQQWSDYLDMLKEQG